MHDGEGDLGRKVCLGMPLVLDNAHKRVIEGGDFSPLRVPTVSKVKMN